ncbi:MAG TPA: DUF484 family protein [Caulobacteraceae bacterium]|nr:DUF484 family protein [Caulobacteraceae bacterium]
MALRAPTSDASGHAPSQPIDPEALRSLLRSNAEWLKDEAELLAEIGLREDVANVVDFGPIALSRVSEAHQRESSERRRLEAVARANFAAQAQTHAAVIDLLEAESLPDLAARLDELSRTRFGLATGAIAVEGGAAAPRGWVPLVEGQVDALIGSHKLSKLGRCPTAVGLFGSLGPEIGSAALLRLQMWKPARQGVIAFGALDPLAFSEDMGAELVMFLARVVERTAERWPGP